MGGDGFRFFGGEGMVRDDWENVVFVGCKGAGLFPDERCDGGLLSAEPFGDL